MNPLARSSLLVVAVIVAGTWLGLHVAIADELSADTNKIEGLTLEQARKLVEVKNVGFLPLHGLTSLDVDTAKVLAEFKGNTLILCGLTTLDVQTAKALAEFS
jgi:hypothetical protein